MPKLGLILVLISACGTIGPKKSASPAQPTLGAKAERYLQLLESHQDSDGFIMTNRCDATLFSGLLSAVKSNVNVTAADKGSNEWHRRPAHDCGPEFGNSRSTISRDMMIGVFYYLWYHKDLHNADLLMNQLIEDNYILKGEGTLGELAMTPAMVNTLALIIKGLGGPHYKWQLAMPVVFGNDGGFIAHLTVWHILLRGEIEGSIRDLDRNILEFHALRDSNNPLFVAAWAKYSTGDFSSAISLLMNEAQWPADHLPTEANHCSEWPIQRDPGADWAPCNHDNPAEHTGAELVLIYYLIIK